MSNVIKDKVDRQKIFKQLEGDRNRAIFLIGINTGMQPKEFTSLTYRQYFRKYAYRNCKHLRQVDDAKLDLPLFSNAYKENEFINPRSINRIIKEAAEKAGLSDNYKITTESLRKTYYYDLYVKGTTIEIVTQMLNHHSPKKTTAYLEITNSDIAEHMKSYIKRYLEP